MSKKTSGVIVTIPGQETPPKAFCGMLLELADEIVNIALVVEWKDGSTNTANTNMSNADRVWLAHVFNRQFRDVTGDEEP